MNRPFSQACVNNRQPILEVLQDELASCASVLEVGSGTGQHAVYFAQHLPHLSWQTSDRLQAHEGINSWLSKAALPNTPPVMTLDVRNYDWAMKRYDAVFTANTLHIMSLEAARDFVRGVAGALGEGGRFIVYGPFNYAGKYTSEGNARFDQWLYQQDPRSAIRDFEVIDQCAREGGMVLHADHAMPANNRLLIWRKPST